MSVSWDRRIEKAQRRFKLLNEFNTEAVLDMALTLSTAIELFQVYTHDRIPTTTDICTNLLGAVLALMIEQWQ